MIHGLIFQVDAHITCLKPFFTPGKHVTIFCIGNLKIIYAYLLKKDDIVITAIENYLYL